MSLGFASLNLPPLVKISIVFPLSVLFCYLISHYLLEKIHIKKRPKDIQIDYAVVFDLDRELEKGSHAYSIPSLANRLDLNLVWTLLIVIGIPISLLGIGFIVHSKKSKNRDRN